MGIPIPDSIDLEMERKVKILIQQGYDQLERKLGGREAERIWRRGAKAGSASFIADAKSLTPVKSGKLRRSVNVRPPRQKYRRNDFFALDFGYFGRGIGRKALSVEYGNVKVREHAPLRTAFERNRTNIIRGIGEELNKEVAKVARSLGPKLRSNNGRRR